MSVSVTAAGDVPPDALVPSRLPVWADRGDLVVWDGACRVCAACRAGRPAACGAPVAVARGSDRAHRRAGAAALADHPELLFAAAVADEVVRAAPAAPAVVVLGDGPVALAVAHAAAGAGAVAVALLGEAGNSVALGSAEDAAAGTGPAEDAAAGTAPAEDAPAGTPAQPAGPIPLFTSPDPDAVRAWIAPRASRGRADLVLAADGDLAAAARLVRRGGAIATTTAAPGPRPSVTTLVQRELELLAPHDLVRGALVCALAPISPVVPHPHPGGPHGS